MSSQSQQTILLVEDHREFQELVTTLLEAEGFAVVAAGTGAAALAALETLRPALILLDSSLPDDDGVQVARAIRARHVGAPIVLMTTDARAGGLATEIGAVEILVKPFSTAALLAAVRTRVSGPTAPDINIQTGPVGGIVPDTGTPTRELDEASPVRVAAPTPQPAASAPAAPVAPVAPATGAVAAQWEYCQLIAAGRSEMRGETYYSVDLIFLGATVTSRRIASRDGSDAAPWTTNPWKQAIGLLGQAGWEMVNIQHGDYAGRAAEGSTLSWNTVVAYFRRPALPNRPITEPKISVKRT